MSIYGRKSINGSVEWLGVPAPSCDTGVTWTEIPWFLIRVEEMDESTNFGILKIALYLFSMALMAGLMNSGYNFRVEILLVVSVDKILLIV